MKVKMKSFEQVRWEIVILSEKTDISDPERALELMVLHVMPDIRFVDFAHVRTTVMEAIEQNPNYDGEMLATWIAHAMADIELIVAV